MVIAIGGTAGLVDVWRGILLCDVLKVVEGNKPVPQLRYVALPPRSLQPTGDARLSREARDVAVVGDEEGRMVIKYVQMQVLEIIPRMF
jgi:hypothetical protein